MKERRHYHRADVELPARFMTDDLPQEATVINISAGGFCFYAQRPLPVGSRVVLTVDMKPKEEIKLIVKTAWSKKIGQTGDYMIGVKINDADGTDLEKFLKYYSHELSEFLSELEKIKKD